MTPPGPRSAGWKGEEGLSGALPCLRLPSEDRTCSCQGCSVFGTVGKGPKARAAFVLPVSGSELLFVLVCMFILINSVISGILLGFDALQYFCTTPL